MLDFVQASSTGITTMDMFLDTPPLGGTPFGAAFGNLCLLETIQLLKSDLQEKAKLLRDLQQSGEQKGKIFSQELVFVADVTKNELGSFYDLYAYWAHVDPNIINSKAIMEFKGLTLIDGRSDWFYNDRLWFTMDQEGPDFFAQYTASHQPNYAVLKENGVVLQIKGIKLKSNVIVEMRLVKNN